MKIARLVCAAAIVPVAALSAQSPFDSLHFRSIGPAATGGRVQDIEVDPKDRETWYVAAATDYAWFVGFFVAGGAYLGLMRAA